MLLQSNNKSHTVLTAYVPAPHNQANATCSHRKYCSPDDGHNDARNVLMFYQSRNKLQITVTSSWFYFYLWFISWF